MNSKVLFYKVLEYWYDKLIINYDYCVVCGCLYDLVQLIVY